MPEHTPVVSHGMCGGAPRLHSSPGQVIMPGLLVPIARSDCLPDRAAWQIDHKDIFQDPPLPQCWTSAAARPWRLNFELESSPSTLAASIRNSPYPSQTE